MRTSAKGRATLEHEEGMVLRSYLCPAGKWTIGPGITSAAGVGRIGPRMQISLEQAREMTRDALAKNYEPTVGHIMGRTSQTEFDAGVLFHWNTGAIKRASWVTAWKAKASRSEIARRFRMWNRGGGKILPGLAARRERELAILFDGNYPVSVQEAKRPKARPADVASWAVPATPEEKFAVQAALARLGYGTVTDAAISASAVERFQVDHALTADGIIGRATLSTLQRRVDAPAKAVPVAGTGTAGAISTASGADLDLMGLPHAGAMIAAAAVLAGLYLCWRYRDVIAVKVQRSSPRLAIFLRSF